MSNPCQTDGSSPHGDYEAFISNMKLIDIFVFHSECTRACAISDARAIKEFNLNISRASHDPAYSLEGSSLAIPLSFRIEILSSEKEIASLEYHFEALFSVSDLKAFHRSIEDDEVSRFFLGPQMDKFVWSYLRCLISSTCSNMGIARVVLPMMM